MRVYAESNYVLELALRQEQCAVCESLLELAETGRIEFALPVYALVEPHETLVRRGNNRHRIQREVDAELRQLERTEQHRERLSGLRSTTAFLAQSSYDEVRRFERLQSRLLDAALLLSLTPSILRLAAECRHRHALLPPDSVIYATVLDHLQSGPSAESCFVTRDREGFDDPEISSALAERDCRLILEFEGAYRYVLSRISG